MNRFGNRRFQNHPLEVSVLLSALLLCTLSNFNFKQYDLIYNLNRNSNIKLFIFVIIYVFYGNVLISSGTRNNFQGTLYIHFYVSCTYHLWYLILTYSLGAYVWSAKTYVKFERVHVHFTQFKTCVTRVSHLCDVYVRALPSSIIFIVTMLYILVILVPLNYLLIEMFWNSFTQREDKE